MFCASPRDRLKSERKYTMAVNVNDKIRKLSASERKKVEARAAELIAEEMSLVARRPDRPPVVVTGIAESEQDPGRSRRPQASLIQNALER